MLIKSFINKGRKTETYDPLDETHLDEGRGLI